MTIGAPEGWYPDPEGLAYERYFDGAEWTSRTREKPTQGGSAKHPAAFSSPASSQWLIDSASRVGRVADTFAWIFLLVGIFAALVLVGASVNAASSPYNEFNDVWPVGLILAVILLLSGVLSWLTFRLAAVVAFYVALRAKV